MAKKIQQLQDLVFDEKNINKGSEYGTQLLEKSLKELGAGRSVLADRNGVLIAGNKTVKKCEELGINKVKVVEITGDELVVVQRLDLDINSPEGAKMKILDNTVSKHNYVEDLEVAEVVCEEFQLEAIDLGMEKQVEDEGYGTEFTLKDGDKEPFQQMTFTLANEQAEQIKEAIAEVKKTEEFKYMETMGNENSNGNALYLIIMQWAEQRK
jgi:hypothetical protein